MFLDAHLLRISFWRFEIVCYSRRDILVVLRSGVFGNCWLMLLHFFVILFI